MSGIDYAKIFLSENRANIPVYPLDVFALTDTGTSELRGATQLPPEALAILVLLDAKATVGDIEQKMPQLSPGKVRDLLRSMVSGGLVRQATIAETDGLDFSAYFSDARSNPDVSEGVKASALREAAGGAPQLASKGFYVSIARQAVKARTPAAGARLSVFMVEDDPDVAGLVRRLLEGAGFEVATAASREAVVARLRRPPLPDAVILDVNLPDVNGFDVLQRMKSHPALKAIPVIMLTAEAGRDSVMRGVIGGADGYITKPFRREILLGGVRAVLGIGA